MQLTETLCRAVAEHDLASLRQACHVCCDGRRDVWQVLLSGADVNGRDLDGHTALMVACAIGDVRLAKLLLRHRIG